MNVKDETGDAVYVVLIQQPVPQCGAARVEVFRCRGGAVTYLRAAYERFLARVPAAEIREWSEDADGTRVAAGMIRTAFTSWLGQVVRRSLDNHPPSARV